MLIVNGVVRLVLALVSVARASIVVVALLFLRSGLTKLECVEELCSYYCPYDSWPRRSRCCVLVLTLCVLLSFSLLLLFEMCV